MPNPLKLNLLMAFPDKLPEPLNLTDRVAADGTLDWTAPADSGTWTLYAIFNGLHSRMVKRAAPGGEGHVPDHLSGEAIGHYLAKFDQALAGKNLDGFRSYFSDSYEVDNGTSGEANFTPHFFEEFQRRRGWTVRGPSDRDRHGDHVLDLAATWPRWDGRIIEVPVEGEPGTDLHPA